MKVSRRSEQQGCYRFPRSLRPGDLLYSSKKPGTAILVLTAQYSSATPSVSVVSMVPMFPPTATGLSVSFMEAEGYRLLEVGETLVLEQE